MLYHHVLAAALLELRGARHGTPRQDRAVRALARARGLPSLDRLAAARLVRRDERGLLSARSRVPRRAAAPAAPRARAVVRRGALRRAAMLPWHPQVPPDARAARQLGLGVSRGSAPPGRRRRVDAARGRRAVAACAALRLPRPREQRLPVRLCSSLAPFVSSHLCAQGESCPTSSWARSTGPSPSPTPSSPPAPRSCPTSLAS